jgi:hypothetical protein
MFFVEERAEGDGFDGESAYTRNGVVLDTDHTEALATGAHESEEVATLKGVQKIPKPMTRRVLLGDGRFQLLNCWRLHCRPGCVSDKAEMQFVMLVLLGGTRDASRVEGMVWPTTSNSRYSLVKSQVTPVPSPPLTRAPSMVGESVVL